MKAVKVPFIPRNPMNNDTPSAKVPLFVVIRLSFYNGASAIEGLGEDESHHLVREGHLRE